ncbi:uncharacterized protein Pyn_11376 [Prunus yedoensis var. nudiflora]|uniref:Uncharacterized protein n=1 Tax=Prunus yedoensis var. nudiflora TaxID=2094558 RepID=A0A314Y6H0_PRUYE|nr:uncharacterized protein Pyn_11376 [Prunus yedoensis var. nudiflora]
MAADTALQLPAALPPTPPVPGTSDMAADIALHLPASATSYSSSSRNIRHSCRHCPTSSSGTAHDHRLLHWQDAICEAITLGCHVDFLLDLVRNLARVVFGARAIHSMRSLPGPDEVKVAAEALNFKQQELENQRWQLHALILTKGVSVDGAGCVAEAVARSSR